MSDAAHDHDHDHPPRPDGWSLSSDDELRRGARILAALGDPERLRLLQLIAPNELCVSELVEATDAKPTTVSQRLRLLRDHDLVRSRREGKHVYYRLADDHVIALLRSAIEHAVEVD
jgi:ArsR family transcriptional regulator, lead/cadmium/zinc/bismuth-responsive transcriptional repressor